jgi:hypothetical protein
MDFTTEFSQLGAPVDIDGLAHLGHDFEVGTVEITAPEASVQVHAHCRLCGEAFRIERVTHKLWPSMRWRLAEESRHQMDQPCHSRRALMLQHYSRIRSLIDEKQGNFNPEPRIAGRDSTPMNGR